MILVRRSISILAAALLGCLGNGACERERPADTADRGALPAEQEIASIPLGDVAGPEVSTLRAEIHNPYAGDAAQIRAGESLFHDMNCVSCHGYGAKGGMGPDLTDDAWRYGGTPAEIYKSIYEGRPKGMPAWGTLLPREAIWELTAYIQSLGGAVPPAQALRDFEGYAAEAPKGRRSDDN